ncbi:MAG: Proline--tRNA ligase [Chlamydiae bacterium]|nr:Proline--tRNA ligase [Chlamydiota bacterium]
MTISNKLKKILDENGVSYAVTEHPAAFTSQEIAGAQHIPGSQLLKSVIVKSDDGTFHMVVISTNQLVDFDKFEALTKSKEVSLASEDEISQLFPDYELGAEPPFGNLYGLKVYADRSIEGTDTVYFNGGSHTDLVKMKLEDYLAITKPIMGDLGRHI